MSLSQTHVRARTTANPAQPAQPAATQWTGHEPGPSSPARPTTAPTTHPVDPDTTLPKATTPNVPRHSLQPYNGPLLLRAESYNDLPRLQASQPDLPGGGHQQPHARTRHQTPPVTPVTDSRT